MSEVEKEVSVEKEKPNEPAEVKKEEEKPVAAELPTEPQVEDENNEDAENVSEKKKKKKKKSKKKFAGRSGSWRRYQQVRFFPSCDASEDTSIGMCGPARRPISKRRYAPPIVLWI